ncbi:pyruvate-flavodoxin oxidoreductase [Klebsiella variicola]|nr:pyruvate-flavodoxin oxidoreductase [Klebsiella variicola]
MRGQKYVLQVAPEDCTGCNLCVEVCPAKDRQNPEIKAINMMSRLEHVEEEKVNYDYFLNLPEIDRTKLERIDIRTSQLISPLFEYSGACSGCGETPYIKLLTQLYGDRMLIANATGCSSIYGGNLPSTPYTTDANGRGPAWANSLFEDNAEFGLGFRLTVDQHRQRVMRLLSEFADKLPAELNAALHAEATPEVRREQVAALRQALAGVDGAEELLTDADALVEKSVWLIGGDGWAYDIGFGGLDHVLSLTENVNILVLDTQCYSNTGGQASKATPLGAVTKFGEHGKRKARKDSGRQHDDVRSCLCGADFAGRAAEPDGESDSGSGSLSGTVADHRLQSLRRARLRSGAQPRSDASADRYWDSGRSTASTRVAQTKANCRWRWILVRRPTRWPRRCSTSNASVA